jgi:hypothetical protein
MVMEGKEQGWQAAEIENMRDIFGSFSQYQQPGLVEDKFC